LPTYEDQAWQDELENVLEPFIFDYVRAHKGSVSAEHGIGSHKPHFLGYSKS